MKNKKMIIGIGIFLAILFILFIYLFIFPIFNSNKYGDRLDDIDKHKISTSLINEIKKNIKESNHVTDVTYHNEGRILNFTVTLNSDTPVSEAKDYGKKILEKLSDDDKSFYDISLFLVSKDKSDNYPVIGYKSKKVDDFNFGSAGEQNE